MKKQTPCIALATFHCELSLKASRFHLAPRTKFPRFDNLYCDPRQSLNVPPFRCTTGWSYHALLAEASILILSTSSLPTFASWPPPWIQKQASSRTWSCLPDIEMTFLHHRCPRSYSKSIMEALPSISPQALPPPWQGEKSRILKLMLKEACQ
jgi:hypothetical protein